MHMITTLPVTCLSQQVLGPGRYIPTLLHLLHPITPYILYIYTVYIVYTCICLMHKSI